MHPFFLSLKSFVTSRWGVACAIVLAMLLTVTAALLLPFAKTADSEHIYIGHADTADSVYRQLDTHAAGPLRLWAIKALCLVSNYSGHVRPGCYTTGHGSSTWAVWRKLRGGLQSPVRLVVPACVRTPEEMAERLAAQIEPDTQSLLAALYDPAFMKAHELDSATAVTIFIPDTYEVYWPISPAQVMDKLAGAYKRWWTTERVEAARKQQLTPHMAMTLASIVEQETQALDERAMVAGMYLNRLHRGMKLQADPTVKFALRDFGLKRILHVHLQADSPYNTYRHEGLPPGPICVPSLSAIEAVLHPVDHNYLYMCAKEDFSGTHRFAVTYDEHLVNAGRYAAALDKAHIK